MRGRDREESLVGRRSNSSSKGRAAAKFYDNDNLSTDEIEPF
jgi:hypothetical protein